MVEYAVCTFHKCASNWVREIIWLVAKSLNLSYKPNPSGASRITAPVERGGGVIHVFPGGNRKLVKATFGESFEPMVRILLAVRDPRDALVSQLFSWRTSHRNNTAKIEDFRHRLADLSDRDGLLAILRAKEFAFGNQIGPWFRSKAGLPANVRLIRYEDLLTDFETTLRLALEWLGTGVAGVDLKAIEEQTSFETKTARKPGVEDRSSHFRKGVSGDHKNYFDDEIAALFDANYGDLTRRLGY